NLDARRTSAFEQRDRAQAQAHRRHREGASAQHFRQARAAQSHATRDACQCSTSTMTANWTLTTISVWDEQRITPMNKVAMKFLGTTTVIAPIVLIILTIWMAFASPAHADDLDCNKIAFTNMLVQADCGMAQTLQKLHREGRVSENLKVKYDGNGHVDAVLDDERGNLFVSNPMMRTGSPMGFVYHTTPSAQLPACDSAEVVQILARITNRTLSSIYAPTTMGSNNGKNICHADMLLRGRRTYTVEWLDQANGRYWVQITGSLR